MMNPQDAQRMAIRVVGTVGCKEHSHVDHDNETIHEKKIRGQRKRNIMTAFQSKPARPWSLPLFLMVVALQASTTLGINTSNLTKNKLLVENSNNNDAVKRSDTNNNGNHQSSSNNNNNKSPDGLVWEDLSIRTTDGKLVLLHPFSGRVPAGQVCGILGPSGAGKSSFLAAIAGLSSQSIQGEVYSYHRTKQNKNGANGKDSQDVEETYQRISSSQVAWLQQHDDFFSMLTVEETVQLAAFLELPYLTQAERNELVHQQLRQLGLAKVASRPVGEESSTRSTRISGGERRRLAVALELLTDKQILLADEATSGLDANMSQKVMDLIQQVARDRHIPAICSLHQPRSSIWRLLDHVIILASGGHVCYSGPRRDCLPYFAQIGYPCPSETNPAEFLMDLVSVETMEDQQRVDDIVQKFAKREKLHSELASNAFVMRDATASSSSSSKTTVTTNNVKRTGRFRVLRRFGALLRRSWRQNIRNYPIHIFRFVASVLNAVLLASIFPSVAPGKPPSPASVADRVALLSFGAINMCFIAFMKTITLIAEERPVIDREQIRSQYSSLEYLVAKVIAEIPMDSMFAGIFTSVLKRVSGLRISWEKVTATFSLLTTAGASLGLALGCWSADAQVGKTAAIPVLVLLMVVGVINPSGVDATKKPPYVVQWLKRFSPFAYAIEALCLGEYPGMTFERPKGFFSKFRDLPKMGGLAMVQNGDQVIEALGLAQQTYANAMQHMAILSLGYLIASYVGLAAQYWIPKMQRLASSKRNKSTQSTSEGSGRVSSESSSNLKVPVKMPML